MEVYNADEQLKILENWWRQNWLALVSGLLLGLAVIVGWRVWNAHNLHRSEQASALYEQLQTALQGSDGQNAVGIGKILTSEYGSTSYAALGALALAADMVKRNDYAGAAAQLKWVADHADDKKLKHIGRLREARVLWSQGNADAALAVLDVKKTLAYEPLYQELRGDIYASQGKNSEARTAYQAALDAQKDASMRTAVEQKLNDLNAEGAPAAAPANG